MPFNNILFSYISQLLVPKLQNVKKKSLLTDEPKLYLRIIPRFLHFLTSNEKPQPHPSSSKIFLQCLVIVGSTQLTQIRVIFLCPFFNGLKVEWFVIDTCANAQ